MSSGSALGNQLVGKSDVITVLEPETSFWQFNFSTHTPFQIEPKRFEFTGSVNYGKLATCKLQRTGDFYRQTYFVIEIDQLDSGNGGARFCDDFGRALIEEVKCEIGNVTFNTKQAEILHVEEELWYIQQNHLGKVTGKAASVADLVAWAKSSQLFFIPLTFWWFDVPYPIVAAFMTEPTIKIKLRKKEDLIVSTGGPYTVTTADAAILDAYIQVEIVLLDEGERNSIADAQNVYVIDQTQRIEATFATGTVKQKVTFTANHPVREFILLLRKQSNLTANNYFNFSGEETGKFVDECFKSLNLRVNGNDRWEPQTPLYHRVIQAKQYQEVIPTKHIYTWSFALDPKKPNPSGSFNFSRVDNADFNFEFSAALSEPYDLIIYARNHNSISIEKGVCRLAFAA